MHVFRRRVEILGFGFTAVDLRDVGMELLNHVN